MAAFGSLSTRLTETLAKLRTKGKLSAADVDGTVREIRRALLDADVALEVVKSFTAAVRERALGAEVSEALNPAQQVVQIVNDELVGILGGESRRLELAKQPPTVIMLAGLQGAGKTTLAGKLAKHLLGQGHTPLLVASDLQRPNAVTQLQVVGGQAGVPVFAPEPGNGVGDPVRVARDGVAVGAVVVHLDLVGLPIAEDLAARIDGRVIQAGRGGVATRQSRIECAHVGVGVIFGGAKLARAECNQRYGRCQHADKAAETPYCSSRACS